MVETTSPSTATPAPQRSRRAMIYTVHGTFDHKAGWDDWDASDAPSKPARERRFINRLSGELARHGITLTASDHIQYDWSGGNSHDERRTAAIGLKKLIQDDLTAKYAKHGADYYDGGVYIVGHSHGGTVARLAVNMWDSDSEDYEPIGAAPHPEAHKLDDRCPTCMRQRHGKVGPNTVPKPDRVFTFGSPFVTFETRRGASLLSAKVGIWILRVTALLPVIAAYIYMAYLANAPKVAAAVAGSSGGAATPGAAPIVPSLPPPAPGGTLDDTLLQRLLQLALPLVLYWIFALYIPKRIGVLVRRFTGPMAMPAALSYVVWAFGMAALALVGFYYAIYITGAWKGGMAGGWAAVTAWAPYLESRHLDDKLYWVSPLIAYWLLAVSLPGRGLDWMQREVVHLRERLPKKYDPRPSGSVPFVSYHTPGDEAGVHLTNFGFITWLIQTLSLTSVAVAILGFGLAVLVGIDTLMQWSGSKDGLAGLVGITSSASLLDALAYLPAQIWSALGGPDARTMMLGTDKLHLVPYLPGAMINSVLTLLLSTVPLALLAIAAATLVSARLRGSGKVFGSEKLAWTLANRIGVTRRANDNTMLRTLFISPEAWRHGELAHCYYYKSGAVISDLANRIADPGKHKPDAPSPVPAYLSLAACWTVVGLFMLSVFAAVVPKAAEMHVMAQQLEQRVRDQQEVIDKRHETGLSRLPRPAAPPVPAAAGTVPQATTK